VSPDSRLITNAATVGPTAPQASRRATPRPVIKERQPASAIVARRGQYRRDQQVMQEGERATEQLMLALRFASSKLNLVQKKVQVNKESGPAS